VHLQIALETSSANPGGTRFHELDSMRGLAAAVVTLHHFFFMWFYPASSVVSLWAVLRYPFVAGRESVVLFFLLSGFVLSVPYLRGKGQSYPVFLVRRLLRIYCPYLFALALAVAGNAIWHGPLGMGFWADQTWLTPIDWHAVWEHVLMIGSYDPVRFNTAFWSLVDEMRISLIFPFLFLVVHRMKTFWALLLAAVCSLAVHYTDRLGGSFARILSSLAVVTIFICGVMMAMHLDRMRRWYRGMSRERRVMVAAMSFVLYEYGHLLPRSPLSWMGKMESWHVSDWPVMVGAAGLMLIGLESEAARKILNSAVPKFLGRISYSLYLIHGTVLFALTYTLHGRVPVFVIFLAYLVTTLLVATMFCLSVEEPFLRLGRRIGRSSRVVKESTDVHLASES
jgi:peptidoglycan/LPS O-acetylase OafA/YrhL